MKQFYSRLTTKIAMIACPLSVHFEVTNRCNNCCPHCYASSWIDDAELKKTDIFEVAKRIAESNVFDLVITGGEPLLLGIEVLCKIFNYLQKQNIQFLLNSNGRLLSKETCEALRDNGLNGVLISLHSWNDLLHNKIVGVAKAAEETKRGIETALDSGINVSVNQVIGKRNVGTMLLTSLELQKMGVSGVSFSRQLSPLDMDYRIPLIEADKFLDEYIKCKEKLRIPVKNLIPTPYCADSRVKDMKERLNCTGGLSSAAISCEGDVRFCPQDPKIWGNLFKENLDIIWERIVKWRNNVAIPNECTECGFLEDCRGGCRVASKSYNGSYMSMDPWATGSVNNYIRKVIYHEFELESLHMLMPDIRYREEKNNFLLYCRNEFINVNADGVQLVRSLPRKFFPNEVLANAGENYSMIKAFLELLYQKGFLININRKEVNEEIGLN